MRSVKAFGLVVLGLSLGLAEAAVGADGDLDPAGCPKRCEPLFRRRHDRALEAGSG